MLSQVTRVDAVARGWGGGGAPLVLRTLHPEGPEGPALGSLQALAPQGCVADIYVYTYIYIVKKKIYIYLVRGGY